MRYLFLVMTLLVSLNADWKLKTLTDEMTDEKSVILVNQNPKNILMCSIEKKQTVINLSTHLNVFFKGDVIMVRVDKNKAMGVKAITEPKSVYFLIDDKLLTQMKQGNEIKIQVITYNSSELFKFDLKNFSKLYKKLK